MNANKVYDCLVDMCGANEAIRAAFVHEYRDENENKASEWRFQGSLGYGGKFILTHNSMYVECYQEDETPTRLFNIKCANEYLFRL